MSNQVSRYIKINVYCGFWWHIYSNTSTNTAAAKHDRW